MGYPEKIKLSIDPLCQKQIVGGETDRQKDKQIDRLKDRQNNFGKHLNLTMLRLGILESLGPGDDAPPPFLGTVYHPSTTTTNFSQNIQPSSCNLQASNCSMATKGDVIMTPLF